MNENAIGKEAVGRRCRGEGVELGFLLNFGANGIERVVNGLPEENLGVLASWREKQAPLEPLCVAKTAAPHG